MKFDKLKKKLEFLTIFTSKQKNFDLTQKNYQVDKVFIGYETNKYNTKINPLGRLEIYRFII